MIYLEAAELSSLKPQLDKLRLPLYAVVKEDVGTEVQNFRPFFSGEVFLDDEEAVLWAPRAEDGAPASWSVAERCEGLQKRLNRKRLGGSFVLGWVFVVGRGQQGIFLEHRNKVSVSDVL
ncbi:peroxiredoxin-like 2A isoform X2 [Kryptolebias marmoratus]|uniref:peroxiredoxin-like 2A isoform X2 n=1 Tax=Kryptolebias marmoratus TaxID=37003 RepID=UPI0007F8B7E1|nr:peroxiredoxin-like 2A isoform X2 [Kryptolebias marmoratus]